MQSIETHCLVGGDSLWDLLPDPAETTEGSAAEPHREGADFKRLVSGARFLMVVHLCAKLRPVANLGDLLAAADPRIEREAQAAEDWRDSFVARQCKVSCHTA